MCNKILGVWFTMCFANSFGLNVTVIRKLIGQVNPSSLIYHSDSVNFELVSVAQESIQVQFVSNSKDLQAIVGLEAMANSVIVVSISNVRMLTNIWNDARQHNLIHCVWFLTGTSLDKVQESMSLSMETRGFGFSPQMSLFFLDQNCEDDLAESCLVIQIIGNGLKPPLIKVGLRFIRTRSVPSFQF